MFSPRRFFVVESANCSFNDMDGHPKYWAFTYSPSTLDHTKSTK